MRQYLYLVGLMALAMVVSPELVLAAEGSGGSASGYIPIGAGLVLGLAALGGAFGQGKAISSGLDSIGRNPSAAGKVTTPMYVGLAFIESLVILSFVIALFLNNKV